MEIPVIRNISDTAKWVAAYRAMETERSDALFQDRFAKILVGDSIEMIRALPRRLNIYAPIIVRTVVLDELLLKTIEKENVDMVINLAAGLDTRPYRLPLRPNLKWVEVDLPDILAYKEDKLKSFTPVCRLERVKLDLSQIEKRRELFRRLNAESSKAIVICEGILIYLGEDVAVSLARDLSEQPHFRWWLIDYATPLLLGFLKKQLDQHLKKARSEMIFGVPGAEFFVPHGWNPIEVRYGWPEGERLKRVMPGAWLFKIIMRFVPSAKTEPYRTMNGFALFENRVILK